MGTITLTAYRGYQDIGTVGQNTQQLAGNVQSINQILDVGLLNTRDYLHGFIRVEHLIGLGLATLINGNQLTSSGAGGGGGGTTYTASDSITLTGTNFALTNDTAMPGNDMFYGTNGSGTLGWYALSAYSGTVTSVGLSETSSTPIYTVGGTNPVTSSGTIDLTLKTQSANTAFAGPTTGAAAQPTFRALVAADIPSLPYLASGSIQNMESAGWNSSSGAVQISLTVAQDILIPYACTLQEVYILTQGGSGSCTVSMLHTAFAGFPGSLTDMTGGTPPAISGSSAPYTNTTFSGWTVTTFAQGDIIRLTLTANTNFTSVKIILRMY